MRTEGALQGSRNANDSAPISRLKSSLNERPPRQKSSETSLMGGRWTGVMSTNMSPRSGPFAGRRVTANDTWYRSRVWGPVDKSSGLSLRGASCVPWQSQFGASLSCRAKSTCEIAALIPRGAGFVRNDGKRRLINTPVARATFSFPFWGKRRATAA